jgi:hypothetical protein
MNLDKLIKLKNEATKGGMKKKVSQDEYDK